MVKNKSTYAGGDIEIQAAQTNPITTGTRPSKNDGFEPTSFEPTPLNQLLNRGSQA